MLIWTKRQPGLLETEITICHDEKEEMVIQLVSLLRSFDEELICYNGDIKTKIRISDIYYVENTDNKSFVYSREDAFYVPYKLYEMNEILSQYTFCQISKFCIVNLNVVTSIRSLPNSRIEALLENEERVVVSRKYIPILKDRLVRR